MLLFFLFFMSIDPQRVENEMHYRFVMMMMWVLIYSTFHFTSDYLTLLLTHSQTIQYLSEIPLKFFSLHFISHVQSSQLLFSLHLSSMVLPYGSTVQTHTHTHFIHIILSRREVVVAWYGNEKNIKRDGINFSIGSPIMSFPILRPIDDEEDDEKISLRMFQFRRKILISCSEICHVLNSLSLL